MSVEGMNSMSILMSQPVSTPIETAAETSAGGNAGFGQLLAFAQAAVQGAQGLTTELTTAIDAQALQLASELAKLASDTGDELRVGETEMCVADAELDKSDSIEESAGVAAFLAQMMAGATSTPNDAGDALDKVATKVAPDSISPHVETPSSVSKSHADENPMGSKEREAGLAQDTARAVAGANDFESLMPARQLESTTLGSRTAQSQPQGASNAETVVQVAASVLRDSPPTRAPVVATHVRLHEPVGTSRWADELGSRLALMSVRGQHQGSLTLTPEHLGPVEVQISVNRDTANVWFGAQHADTRTALNDAMPRLRELLAASGLSLGQSGVSEQAPRRGFTPAETHAGALDSQSSESVTEVAAPVWRRWLPGVIDIYA